MSRLSVIYGSKLPYWVTFIKFAIRELLPEFYLKTYADLTNIVTKWWVIRLYVVTYIKSNLLQMGANEYKWAQSSSNTTLIAKNVNSASFDSVHETVNGDKKWTVA